MTERERELQRIQLHTLVIHRKKWNMYNVFHVELERTSDRGNVHTKNEEKKRIK